MVGPDEGAGDVAVAGAGVGEVAGTESEGLALVTGGSSDLLAERRVANSASKPTAPIPATIHAAMVAGEAFFLGGADRVGGVVESRIGGRGCEVGGCCHSGCESSGCEASGCESSGCEISEGSGSGGGGKGRCGGGWEANCVGGGIGSDAGWGGRCVGGGIGSNAGWADSLEARAGSDGCCNSSPEDWSAGAWCAGSSGASCTCS